MAAVGQPGYVLFVGMPLVGHLNPLRLQAAEMARRGWRVAVATVSEGVRYLEERGGDGVETLDLGPTGVDRRASEEVIARVSAEPSFARGMAIIAGGLSDLWPAVYDGLVAALPRDRPDLVVVDYAAAAGVDAAEALGLPFVVNNADLLGVLPEELLPPAHGVPPTFSGRAAASIGRADRLTGPLRRRLSALVAERFVGRPLNALRRGRGLPPRRFADRLRDRLVMVNSAFGLEHSRPLPPLIQMTGPMLADGEPLGGELAAWLDEGGPVVYVSMGTLARPTDAFMATLVEALASDELRALWPMRPELRAALPAALPANLRVERWVPSQLAVLRHPRVRAFVTHCGTNSVQESLAAGTPIVGVPMFGAQNDMAQRVVDAGVGVRLAKHLATPAELRAALARVMGDEGVSARIAAVQSSFALAGGVRRAADLIEQAAWVGVDHYRERPRARP
jgi:UDP:flavonoid glycosyltransferase YjiC (YdhE family)